jgi:hypothetical protein
MSDNKPDGIKNATHNTFAKLTCIFVFWFEKRNTSLAVQFRKL